MNARLDFFRLHPVAPENLPDLFPERKKEKSGTGEEPEKTE